VRESRTPGSARGVLSDEHSYRNILVIAVFALPKHIEDIHPSLWRANQLARQHGKVVATGYKNLDVELPGQGWPVAALVELLCQQCGIGEIRLLAPALKAVSKRPIALINPTQVPYAQGFEYSSVPANKLLLLSGKASADLLWSAEQVLKAGTCGAVILWQQHIRAEALRRLSLHVATSESLLYVIRPLAQTQDASPATLRIAVRPSENGVSLDIVKRKGPIGAGPFEVVLPTPVLLSPFGRSAKPARVTEREIPLITHDVV
jgi:protein ImuA